jgi:hypothetical protein
MGTYKLKEFNLFDNNFAHVRAELGFDASCFEMPEHGVWTRDNMTWEGDTVFTDNSCFSRQVDAVITKRKIAWLMESIGVNPGIFANFHQVQHKFDVIMSFLDPAIANHFGFDMKKYIQCPLGGAWVKPKFRDAKKTKVCSLIASQKCSLPGQCLRHVIAESGKNIDLFGHRYHSIKDKSIALDEYAFSVVIENVQVPGYFTEKLIDCILRKTVPVYWGDPQINKHFDKSGILELSEIDDLSLQRYDSLVKIVNHNFELAISLKSTDDNIFKKLKEL